MMQLLLQRLSLDVLVHFKLPLDPWVIFFN